MTGFNGNKSGKIKPFKEFSMTFATENNFQSKISIFDFLSELSSLIFLSLDESSNIKGHLHSRQELANS